MWRSHILLYIGVLLAVLASVDVSPTKLHRHKRQKALHWKQICEKCPPGHHLVSWCGGVNNTKSLCDPCPTNTFRSHWNFLNTCKEFTSCDELHNPGNATHDNKCKKAHTRGVLRRRQPLMARGILTMTSNPRLSAVTPDTTPDFLTSILDVNTSSTNDSCGNCTDTTTVDPADLLEVQDLKLVLLCVIYILLMVLVIVLFLCYRQRQFKNRGASKCDEAGANPLNQKCRRQNEDDLRFLDQNKDFPWEHKPKVSEMDRVESISFSYSEAGNSEKKLMAKNEGIHHKNQKMDLLNARYMNLHGLDSAKTLAPNFETNIMRENDTTCITMLKRSSSNVQLRDSSKYHVPFQRYTIYKTPDRRMSIRFLAGYEKKEVMNDLQIVPFVHNMSKIQQSCAEVQISVRDRHHRKAMKHAAPKINIHELSEAGTQTEKCVVELQDNDHDAVIGDVTELQAYQKAQPKRMSCVTQRVAELSPHQFECYLTCPHDIPEIVCHSGKEFKVNNCNKYVDESHTVESSASVDPQICKSANNLDVGCHSKVFDSSGGQWKLPNSDVQLTVPKGAVPKNLRYPVERQVITDLARFSKYLRDDERFVSPIAQYECKESFAKHVRVDIPHCLKNWDNIHIQWGDSLNSIPFTDVPRLSKENNVVVDVYFTVEAKYISIYTVHFTQFLCSEYNYVPLIHNDMHEVQLGAVLLGKESMSDEQELHMKLFIIDSLYQIVDMKQHLLKEHGNYPLLCNDVLKELPATISSETDVTVCLSPKGDWELQTKADGDPVQNLKQSFKMKSIHCPQAKYLPVTAAEFILVLPTHRRVTCFKGDLQISVFDKKEQKKKTGLLSRIIKRSERENPHSDEQVYHNTMWVNFLFDPVFGKAPRSVLQSDEDIFEYIAAELSKSSIKPLLRKLELTETDWEHIEIRHKDDLREQKLQLLLQYREKMGKDFSMSRVLKCLEDIGQKGLAQAIRDTWVERTEE